MDASSRKAAHPAPAPANAPSRDEAAPAAPHATSAAPAPAAPAAAAAAPAPPATTSLRVGARFPASSNLGFHQCCALARHETAATLQDIRVSPDARRAASPAARERSRGNDKPTGLDHAGLDAGGARLRRARLGLCGNNQCVGCTRQFFTKSFLGDDAAVLARSGGEEPASPRHRAGVASMAWRTTRRFRTNAP